MSTLKFSVKFFSFTLPMFDILSVSQPTPTCPFFSSSSHPALSPTPPCWLKLTLLSPLLTSIKCYFPLIFVRDKCMHVWMLSFINLNSSNCFGFGQDSSSLVLGRVGIVTWLELIWNSTVNISCLWCYVWCSQCLSSTCFSLFLSLPLHTLSTCPKTFGGGVGKWGGGRWEG